MSLEKEFSVRITIDVKQRTKRIRVQGANDAAMEAWDQILMILRDAEKIEHEKEKAELMACQVIDHY